MRMTEYPDRRVWDLNGYMIGGTVLGDRPEITIIPIKAEVKGELFIAIDAPLIIEGQDHQIVGVGFLSKRVDSLTVFRNGYLIIKRTDGIAVTVQKLEVGESWLVLGFGDLADMNMLCEAVDIPPWENPV